MNIAFCISGAARYIENSILTINRICNLNEVKNPYIFIHTWEIEDLKIFGTQDINNVKINKENNREKNIYKILNLYKPNIILLEKFNNKLEELNSIFNSVKFNSYHRNDINLLSMYYSIYKSNELKNLYEKKNNTIFDWVFRIRFDSKLNNDVLLKNLINDKIYIPNECDYHGINDQFAFGNSFLMNEYSSVYLNINKIKKSCYNPEIIMMENIKYKNLPIERININVEINGGMKW